MDVSVVGDREPDVEGDAVDGDLVGRPDDDLVSAMPHRPDIRRRVMSVTATGLLEILGEMAECAPKLIRFTRVPNLLRCDHRDS